MEKQFFMALGLHLLPELQLLLLLCIISIIELFIMLFILKKIYYIDLWKSELIYIIMSITSLAFTMFKLEHITFFCTLFYINTFLYIIFYLCKTYPDKRALFALKEAVFEKKLKKMKGAALEEGKKKFRAMQLEHETEKIKEEIEIKERESKKKKKW